MIEWRRVPWPLWIYSASVLARLAAVDDSKGDGVECESGGFEPNEQQQPALSIWARV